MLSREHLVTVFESRSHIGGNVYDTDMFGVNVHLYGPHAFHTNSEKVWDYVNRFAEFNDYRHIVHVSTARGMATLPLNEETLSEWGNPTDQEIRDLIFRQYSYKQWGVPLEELGGAILNRIPQRKTSSDPFHFTDRFQGVPKLGYRTLVKNMLEGSRVVLGAGPEEWRAAPADLVVYTGSPDRYFEYCHGRLEYRSLRFELKQEPPRGQCQVNECNDLPYTRSVDYRHFLNQSVTQTVVGYEYPEEFDGTNIPYYPKNFGESEVVAERYRTLCKRERLAVFVGRLASYRYQNMDATIAQTMTAINNLGLDDTTTV